MKGKGCAVTPPARLAVAVTGLPGSGKSTLGRRLARALAIDFLDKDDFLERLYEARGTGDAEWRRRLSAESNLAFEAAARASPSAVLVSHWRPVGACGPSGTPTAWLAGAFGVVVEVCCRCPVEIAALRFERRERHPGHLDRRHPPDALRRWLASYDDALPLGIGSLIEIDSSKRSDLDVPLAEIRRHSSGATTGGRSARSISC